MEPVTTLDEAIFLIYPWPEGSILAKLVWEDRNHEAWVAYGPQSGRKLTLVS
jgi:hypothetical protein